MFQPKVVSVIVSEFILGRVYLHQNEVSNRHEVHYRCKKVCRCQGSDVKRNPTCMAETIATPDKYTKAAAKQRHGEVAKQNGVTA